MNIRDERDGHAHGGIISVQKESSRLGPLKERREPQKLPQATWKHGRSRSSRHSRTT
jgi:hypothetical protein